MKTKIDLHLHSNFSDGAFSPEKLIDIAIKKKIPAIALTDHDTAEGNKKALEYSKNKDIKFVPGIEIAATPPENCKELHIVGLFIDSENTKIKEISDKHKNYSIKTAKKIIEILNGLGYDISFEELLQETKGKNFARPFIAKILMRKYPEEFFDRKDVFNKLLGKNGKAFVRPKGTEMKEAIKIIHNARGIAILAHPWYLGEKMKEVIEEFVSLGGDGIEREFVEDEDIPKDTGKKLDRLIKKHNLVVSGGTDFHETKEGKEILGDRGLTKEEFERLKDFEKRYL